MNGNQDEMTITPYSTGASTALSRRFVASIASGSVRVAMVHAMATHGDECGYCSSRRSRETAAEARFRRHMDRVKRLALASPTERNLDAYTNLRISAREYGYE